MRKITLLMTLVVISLLVFMTSASAIGDEYEPVPKSKDTIAVMLASVETDNGQLKLVADRIEWYEGEAADQKFLEREQDAEELGGAPDGYYIVNDQVEFQSYDVDPNAEVLMQLYDHDGTYEGMEIHWNEPVSVDKFKAIFQNDKLMDMKVFPYHLTIKDGKVVKIVQQYIP